MMLFRYLIGRWQHRGGITYSQSQCFFDRRDHPIPSRRRSHPHQRDHLARAFTLAEPFFQPAPDTVQTLGPAARLPPLLQSLTDAVDGILTGKRYLIHDRDPLFTTEFLNLLGETGVKSVRLPPRSPNLKENAEMASKTVERFMNLVNEGPARSKIGKQLAELDQLISLL
jgi:hypothetical protein